MKRNIYFFTTVLSAIFLAISFTAKAQTPFINVIQPDASGITWSAGTKHLISWDNNLTGRVNIQLINYGVHPYDTTVIANNRSGSTYTWRIPSGQTTGNYFKVLVTSKNDPTVYDKSTHYFKIVKGTAGGKIHVEQPSAGNLKWSIGTRYIISWSDNLSERVNIRLINYGVHPYDTTVIANNRSGSTFAWRIPTSVHVGKYYKIMVVSTLNKSIYDRSDHYFSIVEGTAGGNIRVIQPSANRIIWSVGTKHLISWTDNLAERVDIKLINYGVHPYDTTVIANNRSGSTYFWRISSGQTTGSHFKVLVVSTKNKSIYDRSDYYFSLVKGTSHGSIHVEQPSVRGIVWSAGTRHLIAWTDNLAERVNIKLINYGVHPYDTTVIASNRRGSTYEWRIPSNLTAGRYYRVLVESTQNKKLYDKSDNYFSIVKGTANGKVRVLQPSVRGIIWSVGSRHLISWTDNLAERVNIKLINYGVHPYDTTIIASNRGGSTYEWRISSSQTTGRLFKVLVESSKNSKIYDRSDYYFSLIKGTVGGKIHVEQPSKNGIKWAVGQKYWISWSDNLYERVNIKLINYGVHPYDTTTIANNQKGSTYVWRIPKTQTTGKYFKVLVESSVNPRVYDRSDYYFTIIEGTVGGKIHVEQPNKNGISWEVGTKKYISWTDNLTEKVNIKLINYGVHPYDTAIIANNRSGSTYTWNIPSSQTTGNRFKVLIESSVNPKVYDKSDYYFSLVKGTPNGKISIIQPNASGISITQGTDYWISWEDNLTEKVKVLLINYGVSPYDTAVLASSVGGSTYTWHVASNQAIGTRYKVMIVSTVTPSVYAKSAHYFSIVAPTTKIAVYPNPSTTYVTLKFDNKDNENYSLSLYNRYNMRVLTRKVNAAYMKEVRINTFNLPDGVYFLRLTSGKGVISKKIIIQH